MSTLVLDARIHHWPLARPFAIARGVKTSADVVQVRLSDGQCQGVAECVPYPRYDETPAKVLAQIESVRTQVETGISRAQLQALLPAGAARNALDCALWDLEANQAGCTLAELAQAPLPARVITAVTVSLGTPADMAQAAREAVGQGAQLLKVKLDADQVIERVTAIRQAAPQTPLILDANEAWSFDLLQQVHQQLAQLNVALIEQPLPAGQDDALADVVSAVPLCADESCHTRDQLVEVSTRYQMVNIKLDKTGGLTEALALASASRKAGLGIMVGCMVGSSLAMAPALLLTAGAQVVDLDGPLWLKHDYQPALRFEQGCIVTG